VTPTVGDSATSAELVSCTDVALRLNSAIQDPVPYQVMMLEEVRRRAHDFDILHFHIDMLHFPIIRDFADRTITTLHGRLDLPDLIPFYKRFPDIPLISITDSQRRPLPPVNWKATIYHGLQRDVLPFTERPKNDYLAFLGRISPEKRPDRAIEIAARTGIRLKIAAKVDKADQAYWDNVIAPMIASQPNVEYIGEIDEQQKAQFLGNARALLFPIDWPEPFGLVMIEAMACGTPVLAFRCGSVPEVIDNGVSGIIVDTLAEAVEGVEWVLKLDRKKVRAKFEERFTSERMTNDYVAVYRSMIEAGEKPAARRRASAQQLGLQVVA